ncbi:MAG: Fpg/Nei family DNA glycosylase, partial [Chloroflexi bacterium]|nr:Fpg/Nei family DNA glycosylase [Chloroflexota bacterium]
RPSTTPTDPYTRAVLFLGNGQELRFIDPRKLGNMWLVKDEKHVVGKLGPEPLDAAFMPQVLLERLAKRSAPIKALLLDQSFLAGVGNIYADEVLFEAGIHPLRSARSLSNPEAIRLHGALLSVLKRALSLRGTTFSRYQDPQGRPGGHQFQLRVFRRTGQPCLACSAPIQRLSLRSRGTHFCPSCQPI